MEYRHKAYNPMWAGLSMICSHMEQENWMLYHVVPVHQYESVAVFVRPRQVEELNEESEVKFPGDYL